MSETVPETRRVRYRRVGNIDTDRLQRRQRYLRENQPALARQCDGREQLRTLARELLAIEAELLRRTENP